MQRYRGYPIANQSDYKLLTCEEKLLIVPGAMHLFEKSGTLKQVADHAGKWFQQYLHPVEKTAG